MQHTSLESSHQDALNGSIHISLGLIFNKISAIDSLKYFSNIMLSINPKDMKSLLFDAFDKTNLTSCDSCFYNHWMSKKLTFLLTRFLMLKC
jgi:hypothetical protein